MAYPATPGKAAVSNSNPYRPDFSGGSTGGSSGRGQSGKDTGAAGSAGSAYYLSPQDGGIPGGAKVIDIFDDAEGVDPRSGVGVEERISDTSSWGQGTSNNDAHKAH
jgi:hypothetical protein